MNKAIIGILLVLLLANCQRDEPQNLLVGTWRWEQSSGGVGVRIFEPRKGENTYLTFKSNQTFEVTRNDTLFVKGKYQTTNTRSIYSVQDAPAIELTEMVSPRQITDPNFVFSHLLGSTMVIIEITTSRLYVGDNNHDGYSSSFTRK